jgi:hypothetical protein
MKYLKADARRLKAGGEVPKRLHSLLMAELFV